MKRESMQKPVYDQHGKTHKALISKLYQSEKKVESTAHQKVEGVGADEHFTSAPVVVSLVKYDTPFLVSTTVSNRKTLEELDENNEATEIFLRNFINKRGIDMQNGEKSEFEDYSVKDALNKIILPKKIFKNDNLWVQYVSCTPVTKAEVLNLKEGLERRLISMQARDTGICPIRELLYDECFDELIRQVTINCLERGILLMRVKKEIEMTINTYQTLYESAIAYGIRSYVWAEEWKTDTFNKIKVIEDEIDTLEENILKLEKDIRNKTEHDFETRKEIYDYHNDMVSDFKRKNNALKEEIKNKLGSINK
jgi:dynein light intermediate chain